MAVGTGAAAPTASVTSSATPVVPVAQSSASVSRPLARKSSHESLSKLTDSAGIALLGSVAQPHTVPTQPLVGAGRAASSVPRTDSSPGTSPQKIRSGTRPPASAFPSTLIIDATPTEVACPINDSAGADGQGATSAVPASSAMPRSTPAASAAATVAVLELPCSKDYIPDPSPVARTPLPAAPPKGPEAAVTTAAMTDLPAHAAADTLYDDDEAAAVAPLPDVSLGAPGVTRDSPPTTQCDLQMQQPPPLAPAPALHSAHPDQAADPTAALPVTDESPAVSAASLDDLAGVVPATAPVAEPAVDPAAESVEAPPPAPTVAAPAPAHWGATFGLLLPAGVAGSGSQGRSLSAADTLSLPASPLNSWFLTGGIPSFARVGTAVPHHSSSSRNSSVGAPAVARPAPAPPAPAPPHRPQAFGFGGGAPRIAEVRRLLTAEAGAAQAFTDRLLALMAAGMTTAAPPPRPAGAK